MNNRDVELTVAGYCETIGPKRDRRSRDDVFEKRTGRAGYGCVLRCDKAVKVIRNTLKTKSESRAVLTGIVEGLKKLHNPGSVAIYTRDGYLDNDLAAMEKVLSRAHPNSLVWYPERNGDLWREFVEVARHWPISFRSVELKYDRDHHRAVRAAKFLSGYDERYVKNVGPRCNYSGCLD